MKIVFATNNAHKLTEVQAVLGDAYTLVTPRDCGVTEEIPEDQETLEGNASQKARYLHRRTGLDCFADDTGLEVEALGGAPGVHSARYRRLHEDLRRDDDRREKRRFAPRPRRAQTRGLPPFNRTIAHENRQLGNRRLRQRLRAQERPGDVQDPTLGPRGRHAPRRGEGGRLRTAPQRAEKLHRRRTHRELAVQALEAGKPVYVEKPMAMNHAECLEMIAAAEKAGQKLFVAYYRRALLYFLKVKELLDGGSVGQPLTAEVRLLRPERPEDRDPARLPWRLRREVGGEGYFHDLAPHTLDILDFLLGEITDARGCKSNRGGFYDVADTVAASFRFRSGVPGTGMWCFVAPPSAAEDSVVVTGRKGSVRFSTFDFTPVELVTARGVERFEIAPPEHIQGPLIETIVRELRGEGVCPSTGVSAARTSRVMDEIMKE